MRVPITCGSCGRDFSAPSSWAGRNVVCPKCGEGVEVTSSGIAASSKDDDGETARPAARRTRRPAAYVKIIREKSDTEEADSQVMDSQMETLRQQGRNGANWFYWVAGLSLVNSVIQLAGGTVFFVIGLGVTLVVDAIATAIAQATPDIGLIVKVVAFGLDVLVAAIVAGFGWLAGMRYQPVLAIGMVLYFLDGLLFVLFQDWMSAAFHAFALFSMWGGFQAFRQLSALEDA